MHDFLKVFFVTLVSDIDNLLILGTILRRYSYLSITLPAVIVLTSTRTIYVAIVESLSNFPLFHLMVGIILLIVAFKLVSKSIKDEPLPRQPNKSPLTYLKVLLLIASTDFLICLDSVLIISGISQHGSSVIFGIFLSLLITLTFLPFIIKMARSFFWINIIAGAFIAQNAVIGLVKDPWLADWIDSIDKLFPGTNIVNVFANGAVIMIVVTGVYYYIKYHRVSIYK